MKKWALHNEVTVIAISVILLCVVVLVQLGGSYIRRPFEVDELITLRYYSAAGVDAEGKQKQLDRIEDIRHIGRVGIKEFAIGAYCSLGRWTEPNNHLLNSFLMNVVFLFCRCSEQSSRLPSIFGLVILALAVFFLFSRTLKWQWLAPLGMMIAITHPYSQHYGQTARGYIWMLALHLLFLIAMNCVLQKPTSKRWAITTSGLAVLMVMNIISTLTFVVFPVYLAAAVLPWVFKEQGYEARDDLKTRYTMLFCQLLFIGAVCFVFFIDRLPYIASSLHLYGTRFQGLGGFCSVGSSFFQGLFPSIFWKMIAILGLAGLLLGCRSKQRAPFFISLCGIITLCVVVGQALATRQFGYERNYGFMVDYAMVGFIIFCKEIVSYLRGAARKPVMAGIYAAMAVLLIQSYVHNASVQRAIDRTAEEFNGKLSTVKLPEADATVGMVTWDIGSREPTSLYFPAAWKESDAEMRRGQHCNVALLVHKTADHGWSVPFKDLCALDKTWDLPENNEHTVLDVNNEYRVVNYPGRCFAMTDSVPKSGKALFFWYIDPESMLISSKDLVALLGRYGMRYFPQIVRYQAKLSVFGRLSDVVIFSDNEKDFDAIAAVISEGSGQFGNHVVVFVPSLL
jgi:hypothetical protein